MNCTRVKGSRAQTTSTKLEATFILTIAKKELYPPVSSAHMTDINDK